MPTPTLVWSDTFTRTLTGELGSPYTVYWDDGPWASVDGSVLVGPPVGESIGYDGFPQTISGILQFDFLIAAGCYYDVQCSGDNAIELWFFDEGGGQWSFGSNCSQANEQFFYPTPGDWWTGKVEVTAIHCRFKAWKRGDPEPDWTVDDFAEYHGSYSQYLEIDSGTEVGKMDNLFIWSYPTQSPTLNLSDSLWLAEDAYPALRADPDGAVFSGQVATAGFTTDVNDPIITTVPHLDYWEPGGKGGLTAWAKVVLPNRATLDFNAVGTRYGSALLLYEQDEFGALTLLRTEVPWSAITVGLPSATSRPVVASVITAGSGAMATGIPGVTHTMLQNRTYVLFDVWLPGGEFRYGPGYWDFWGDVQPWIAWDVWVSGQNVGYAKSLQVKCQRDLGDGTWGDLVTQNLASIVLDGRLGHSYRVQNVASHLGSGLHEGHYRLVIYETGNGGEIWTDYATFTVDGYHGQERPRLVADLPAGTYLVCLTRVELISGETLADLRVTMTHPVRTDG